MDENNEKEKEKDEAKKKTEKVGCYRILRNTHSIPHKMINVISA